ncbi:MAG: preprotein translocase subunit SecE [Pirellulales bacterium]
MAEKKEIAASPSFFSELFQVDMYKRSQGRIVRQVAFFSLLLVFVLSGWRLRSFYDMETGTNGWTLFLVVSAVGAWISYRIVNWPRAADFLISVEGEAAKVSWPSTTELVRSSFVVIVVMILLSLILWMFDTVWFRLFSALEIIPGG